MSAVGDGGALSGTLAHGVAFSGGPTLAHGVGQATDLPLPLDLVLQAGAATVVLSFLGSALLWRRPRLADGRRRSLRLPWWLLPAAQIVVLVLSLYVVVNALTGPRGPENPAAHAVFVWLWVGLIPVSVVFGPVWRHVNPLRTLFRLLQLPPGGLLRTASAGLGRWPAAVALLAFAWFELIAPQRTDPLVIGLCLLGYASLQIGLAVAYGEEWFARGDCFEVYSELAGRLSPLRWRPPLSGLTAGGPLGLGGAAFVAIWWGSTIFDSGQARLTVFLERSGQPLLLATAGLILVCAVVLAGVRGLGGKLDVTASLIPIAVGYTVAHYLTSLLVEAPRGVLVLAQQWGWAEGQSWTFAPAPGLVAVLQIVLILAGHAAGVVVAHDMALSAAPGRPPLATVADELPVVLFMIACTWAGLFLLFVR